MRTLLVALALVVCSPTLSAQAVNTDSLIKRIESLEARVRALESMLVRNVERIPVSGPVIPSGWRDIQNWRQLKKGMREPQVRALLGEPSRVDGGTLASWWYGAGYVRFYDGKVDGWSEP